MEQLNIKVHPVSYTHLDVYKRQILFSETLSILFFPLFSSPTGEEVWTARPLKSHYFSIVQ